MWCTFMGSVEYFLPNVTLFYPTYVGKFKTIQFWGKNPRIYGFLPLP
jgi:hypothetical protein